MNDLMEVLAFILFTMFVLALVFVFGGDPDIWDAWHNIALENLKWHSKS